MAFRVKLIPPVPWRLAQPCYTSSANGIRWLRPRGCGQARGARLFGGMQVEALRCTSNRERRWPENLAGMRTDRRGKVGAPIHRTRPWKERSNMSGSPWRARARAGPRWRGRTSRKTVCGNLPENPVAAHGATLATSMVPSAAWADAGGADAGAASGALAASVAAKVQGASAGEIESIPGRLGHGCGLGRRRCGCGRYRFGRVRGRVGRRR